MELAIYLFFHSPNDAWNMYLDLPDWQSRENVAEVLRKSCDDSGYSFFTQKYRDTMKNYIRDEFYDDILYNEDVMQKLVNKYHCDGNIEVPFMKISSLSKLIMTLNNLRICNLIIFSIS